MDNHSTTRQIPLVGKLITISIYDVEAPIASSLIADAYDEGRRLQRIFNLYDKKSELSRLNRERDLIVSDELLHILKTAIHYCCITNGAYDIAKGRQSLERKAGMPLTQVTCTYNDIHINGNRVILTHPQIFIDLSSIAKGYITDKIIARIMSSGVRGAFVDARGDLRIAGDQIEVVDIQDPWNPTRHLRPFVLENMAVATSCDYNQHHQIYEQNHVIGTTDLCSVIVVAPTTTEANIIATSIFILGSKKAKEIIEEFPRAKCLLITKDRKEISLNGFDDLLLERQMTMMPLASTQDEEMLLVR